MLTMNKGIPISDDQISLKSGAHGPTLIADFIVREKVTHTRGHRRRSHIISAFAFELGKVETVAVRTSGI